MTPAEKRILNGIRTEIGAGMVMFPKTDGERLYNQACQRAVDIVQNYIDGIGLTQMVDAANRRAARHGVKPKAASAEDTAALFERGKKALRGDL